MKIRVVLTVVFLDLVSAAFVWMRPASEEELDPVKVASQAADLLGGACRALVTHRLT